MTLDQVFFRVCNIKILEREIGMRSTAIDAASAAAYQREDGTLDCVAEDPETGETKRVKVKHGGVSKARRLMQAKQARLEAEQAQKRKRRGTKL